MHLRSLRDIFIASNKNNKPTVSYVPLNAPFWLPIGSSNLRPYFTTLQAPKYSKNNLQQIFKIVLEAGAPVLKMVKEPQKRIFEIKAPNIYRNKFTWIAVISFSNTKTTL